MHIHKLCLIFIIGLITIILSMGCNKQKLRLPIEEINRPLSLPPRNWRIGLDGEIAYSQMIPRHDKYKINTTKKLPLKELSEWERYYYEEFSKFFHFSLHVPKKLSIISKDIVLTEVLMIKHLQKIGNSRGVVLDKPILDLLGVEPDGSFEVQPHKGGLFLKPINARQAYKKISKKHRKSLDKLAK